MCIRRVGTAVTDDIVTRLRGQRTNSVLCEQAADEIEKLRKERDYWREERLLKGNNNVPM